MLSKYLALILFRLFGYRERWSDSRDRNRDRHRDRDRYRDSDRGSYRDNDRDSHRDSDRDRGSTRHSYNNDDFHQSQHALQLQQQAQFDPRYSQPDYWLKAAQQVRGAKSWHLRQAYRLIDHHYSPLISEITLHSKFFVYDK